MKNKNKKIPDLPKVDDTSKLQAHQLARCYRVLVVQPKHKKKIKQ